jgi:hypothetical protein
MPTRRTVPYGPCCNPRCTGKLAVDIICACNAVNYKHSVFDPNCKITAAELRSGDAPRAVAIGSPDAPLPAQTALDLGRQHGKPAVYRGGGALEDVVLKWHVLKTPEGRARVMATALPVNATVWQSGLPRSHCDFQ